VARLVRRRRRVRLSALAPIRSPSRLPLQFLLDVERDDDRPDRDDLALFDVQLADGAVDRRGDLHEGLVRLDLRDRLIFGHRIARLDQPRDQFTLRDTLADIG